MCGGGAMLALLAACALAAAAGSSEDGWRLVAPARYAASSSVLLGAAGAAGARGGELGWRLRAELLVRPLGAARDHALLHFTLESPQLMLRGKHQNAEFLPRPSLWDSVPSSSFLARWSAGRITAAYLDPDDPPDILNYKKSLISLFQFQVAEGERNETDVSGACEVQYEALPDRVYRKIKRRCMWEGAWDGAEEGAEEGAEAEAEAEGVERRRVARYELSAARDALLAVSADELVRLRAHDAAAPLKARALLALARLNGAPPPLDALDGLEAAEALARHPRLTEHALPLRAQDRVADLPEEQSLASAVSAHRAALEEQSAGSAEAASATLRLLPALRRASSDQLLALLHDPASEPLLEGLSRALGLAGSAGAHAAARSALQLAARDPPRAALAREYWAALALAPAVAESVLLDALRLGGAEGALAAPALLAAAAAAAAGPERLQLTVRDAVTKGLARCKEEECRAVRLQALGQLRRADCADVLLEHAERGAHAPALAALEALARAPPGAVQGARRRRLERVALALDAPHALEVRCAALRLALRAGAPHPAALRRLSAALRARGPRELRRVAWRTLLVLAAEPAHAELRHQLSALDPRPADWLRRAYDGTSEVLSRSARWARLDSVQLAARGVLRRGAVHLLARGRPLLAVELWTRGLEALAAAEPELPRGAREPDDEPGEPDDEPVEGGLALTVAGARLPDRLLFSGQGELLGHIWAGTGSEPTGVLRAVLPRAELRATLALQAGVLVDARARAAAALALDAQAAVSLWGRTARAGLALRGAAVALSSLRARTAWGRVTARAHSQAEPTLSLAASLDFYAAPQLCVHTTPDDYTYRLNVTLQSEQGARAWRVRRERACAWAAPGRTLALGARNNAACRTLGLKHLD